jgi:deoxycytidine triphosphate deaminase
MILAQDEILRRLDDGDIFRKDSWCKTSLQEASYALRIANDGLLIDDEFHDPGEKYDGDYIKIESGKIAILSTMELLNMPADLLGKIGIRLKYAHQGLTGLMGIQVDPLYGRDKPAERLYIRVANFGNETIQLSPGDEVFTFELHEVTGTFPPKERKSTWLRMKDDLRYQSNSSWSYVTQVEHGLSAQTQNLKEFLQPLVMFGVFLVSATILGVTVAILLQTPDLTEVGGATWLTDDERRVLFWGLLVGTAGTAWVGFVAGWRFLWPYRINTPRRRKGWIRRTSIRVWECIW